METNIEEPNVETVGKKFFKVNARLLPVKAHYFFFLAAMGPILPFLPVIGKQLGVSEIVMGGVNAVLPLLFIVVKPLFGFLIDYFQEWRKAIFVGLLAATSFIYGSMAFLPETKKPVRLSLNCSELKPCASTFGSHATTDCTWGCKGGDGFNITLATDTLCLLGNTSASSYPSCSGDCTLDCPSVEAHFYSGASFWAFVILMSLGTIGYNVSNSISDAICFDILGDGEQRNYGQQRVWGTIGFGLSALVGGYLIDKTSYGLDVKNYTPAYALAVGLMLLDVATCCKLKFPPLPKSESIVRSITSLVKQPAVLTFLIYAMLVGICDAAMIFYLLWYLEDLAKVTNQIENIKLLQGLTVACETLFGEVVFFYISGYVISRLGYGHCLTLCFALYALRLGLVSALPSPWWILPVETFMQGPTYALCYATIVGYASQVSPPGTSATMQGLVAGMDDGIGYAVGSILGGVLYSCYGGSRMYLIVACIAAVASVTHYVIYERFFKQSIHSSKGLNGSYEPAVIAEQEMYPMNSDSRLLDSKVIA